MNSYNLNKIKVMQKEGVDIIIAVFTIASDLTVPDAPPIADMEDS